MNAEPHRLSTCMRQSIDDRSAWFNLACRQPFSVDLIYWDLLDEYCWGPRSTRTMNFLMLRDREDFVRSKICQLQEYYIELGKGIQVEYEEEESRPLTKDGKLSYL